MFTLSQSHFGSSQAGKIFVNRISGQKVVLLPQCDFQGVRKKKSIFLLSKMFAQKTLVLHYRKSSKKNSKQ